MVVELGDRVFGLLVDAVSEIFSISDSDLQATPNMSIERENSLVRGLIAQEHRMLALVELNSSVPTEALNAAYPFRFRAKRIPRYEDNIRPRLARQRLWVDRSSDPMHLG